MQSDFVASFFNLKQLKIIIQRKPQIKELNQSEFLFEVLFEVPY